MPRIQRLDFIPQAEEPPSQVPRPLGFESTARALDNWKSISFFMSCNVDGMMTVSDCQFFSGPLPHQSVYLMQV